jgi:hypothetical protein
MTFHPGDYIQAVEDDQPYDGAVIRAGQLYCVQSVEPELWREITCSAHIDCRGDGVILTSPTLPEGDFWCSECFRPIYRRKAGLFDKLLEPTDDLVSA